MKQESPQQPGMIFDEGHSIAYSRTTTSRVVGPLDTNPRGNIHGGVIMRMVDEAAAIVAIKHCRTQVVTARVERFDFIAPAYVGNLVSVHCALNYVGRSSMEVGVEVEAEDLLTGEKRLVASSQLIFVALNDRGKPTPVPRLVPANAEEAMIIEKARLRRVHMQKIDEVVTRMQQEIAEEMGRKV